MRHLALDLGDKRIGVAVSDPAGSVATPLTTLERRGDDQVVDELRDIISEYEIDVIVIGLPKREDGSEGPEARRARNAGERLERSLGIDVRFYDERFTSRIVVNAARDAGVTNARRARRDRNRGTVDKLAATLILQGYLDRAAYDDRQSSS